MNLVVKTNDVMLQALTSTKILEMPKETVVNQIYDMLTKAYYDSGIQSPAPKDLVLLSKAIHDEIKAYFSFLRIDELRICLANGIRGEYGEFYGINIKSIHSWIRAYQISEKRRFKLNELKSEQPIEVDKAKIEKEYWTSIRSKFEKFNSPCWKPRRWPWVDPLKDLQASVLAVEKGFKSRRSIIAEMGEDIEEVFQEQAEDNALAESLDLEFPTDVQEKETPEMPETETETTPEIGRAHV